MLKNNSTIYTNHFRYYFLYISLLFLIFTFILCFSATVSAQVAIPLWELNSGLPKPYVRPEVLSIKETLFIYVNSGLWRVNKEGKATQVSHVKGELFEIYPIGEQIFVKTHDGIWIVKENGEATQINGIKRAFQSYPFGENIFVRANLDELWVITKDGKVFQSPVKGGPKWDNVNNRLFISTNFGVWIVSEYEEKIRIDQISNITGTVNRVYSESNRSFINTENGTWEINENGSATLITSERVSWLGVTIVGENLFFHTDESLWISKKGSEPFRISDVKGRISTSFGADDKLFLGTETGIWIINKDGIANQISEIKGRFIYFGSFEEQFAGPFFVATEDGCWVFNKDGKAKPVSDVIKGRFHNYIHLIYGELFVSTDLGLWKVNRQGKVNQISAFNEEISSTYQMDGAKFVLTSIGILIVKEGGEVTRINEFKEPIYESLKVNDQLFLGTGTGLWIINKDGKPDNNLKSVKGELLGVYPIGNYIYAHSDSGLYRLDLRVKINSKLIPDSWWAKFISLFLSPTFLPSEEFKAEAFYSDENGKDPYDKNLIKEFVFAKTKGKFSIQTDFRYPISLWRNDVHYWVRDKWGNTFEQNALYIGVPSQYFISLVSLLILPISMIVLVLGCFAFAPKYEACHSAIMNPWLRKYLSFGSIPFLLSVSKFLRRYILRRYPYSIRNDKEFSYWERRFIYPDDEFLPENFGKKLLSERKLLLTGQSGVGKTTYFKHLMAFYTSDNKYKIPANVFPVYISLINYGGNSLEELIYNQLYSYGKITDKELASMFLERVELLLFLDGVNEVQNVIDRQRLAEFVEKFWTSNYICLSSQQNYPEIENITRVELIAFSPENVCEMLRQRVVDKVKAEDVIKGLNSADYNLYSVPRDLEFGIDILNAGGNSLPKLRGELYKLIFASIFAKWKEQGMENAIDNLCRHAYTMILQNESAFDTIDEPKFKEIINDLTEQKILVRKEKNYYFRHDLIRSYLASEYFYLRWENLFESINERQIDNNWLEMLKFSCENLNNASEVKSLVYNVLDRSIRKDLVKDLFKWIKTNSPSKCEGWEGNFFTKYGELVVYES